MKDKKQTSNPSPDLPLHSQEGAPVGAPLLRSDPKRVSEMKGEKQTPLNPPLSGGKRSPSLDKGRAGEGLGFIPYNKNLTTLARANRNNPTAAESKLWNEVLRMRHFADYKFLRQKPIGGFIVDFYCATLHLAIEIDGDSHAEAAQYDANRTNTLTALGITVVRYANDDVLRNLAGVYDDLMQRIARLDEGFARA